VTVSWIASSRQHMTLRFRMVVITGLAVATVVAVGGLLIVLSLRAELYETVDETALQDARAVNVLAQDAPLPNVLPPQGDLEQAIQVVVHGEVVSQTANLDTTRAFTLAAPPVGEVRVTEVDALPPAGDGPFRMTALGIVSRDGPATVLVAVPLDDIDDVLAATVRTGMVGLVLLLVPLCMVLWAAIGRTLATVEGIRERADAITGRHLDQRVPEPPQLDEIGRLARTINTMLARLQASADQQKQFVADAAHELRSPIASLRAQLESGQGLEARPHQGTTGDLLAETLRMQRLVDQLLLLARGDAGNLPHPTAAVDLDDVVDQVLDSSAHELLRPDVVVDRSGVTPVQVIGDDALLERLVRNLADNAVRHAQHRVRLSLVAVDGRAVLTVDDDGHGVPPDQRAALFGRFTRLESSRDREDGGVGLGLAIVAGIVSSHAGRIEVLDSPDGGARFRVELPLAGQGSPAPRSGQPA
jgi:signal transduction histidine kinase